MKVLVACEESQAVCREFRRLGHEAYSCDVVECSGGHPEWHIKGDVLDVLTAKKQWIPGDDWFGYKFRTQDGRLHCIDGKWDMIIAFPPCTHLAVSGACRFAAKRADGRQREGLEFFMRLLFADCEHVCVENPVNIVSGKYPLKWFPDIAAKYSLPIKPTQTIQPYEFGHPESKKTCLWLRGLPPLKPTNVLELPECGYWDNQTPDGQNKLIVDGHWIGYNDPRTAIYRSKTYPGIAKAMAEQFSLAF